MYFLWGEKQTEAAAIYRPSSRSQAERASRRWTARCQKHRPRAVASVEGDLEELLNIYALPPSH